jgi:hypothetical protein
MKKLITIFLLFMFNQSTVLAYDSYNIHPKINENASRQAKNLSSALRDIGFVKGVDSVVNGKKIYLWFRDGGTEEDSPEYRADNHFHDPLKPWSGAGLKGSTLGLSSLIWAQNQTLLGASAGGDWSWKKARTLYYDALTSEDANIRERGYADTFKSLGHVMHLMADSSVPAHVRNDIHIFPLTIQQVDMEVGDQTYESWAKRKYDKLNYVGSIPDQSIFSQAVSDAPAPVPISALWDQDKYTGSNPELTVGTGIGLAEYTNANFFSEDTIFKDYPHPAYSDTNYPNVDWSHPEIVDAEDGKLDSRIYIRKTVGDTDSRLASLSYISYDCIKKGYYQFSPLVLDDTVYTDYASRLIPRAVGYSAALLDYFFRGNIEMTLPPGGVYSATDDEDAGFTSITLLAQNKTSTGDDMSSGTIELVVKYRIATSDPFKTGPIQTGDYNYKVVPISNGLTSIPSDTPAELGFDLRGDPLPVNAVDVSLLLVYHGLLGMEDDAVAVGYKDINDPTPIDIYNNMDKICINGAWYDAGSQPAIQKVDNNGDGIAYGTNEWDVYPHNLRSIYITFYNDKVDPDYASPAYHDYEVNDIPVQGFRRALYVLGDDNFNYSFYAVREGTDQNDYWTHVDPVSVYSGVTIKNQVEDPPVFFEFRGYSMWPGSGFIYVNPAYPEDSQCDPRVLQ